MEIHEFDFGIYPRRLYIAIGRDFVALRKDLQMRNGEELPLFEGECYGAATYSVIDKSDLRYGLLIYFPSRKDMKAQYIAHEATHAALELCRDCDITVDFDNQEPIAYIVGFVAGCAELVKKVK